MVFVDNISIYYFCKIIKSASAGKTPSNSVMYKNSII